MSADPSGAIRLAKLLAKRGVASRRKAEQLIVDGCVAVNGELVTHPATMVHPVNDRVNVNGVALPKAQDDAYYLFYKPKGCITTRTDPHGRKTVFDLLGKIPEVVQPIGRLDFDTEGALLLTNDGALAHALTHPSRKVPKRYLAKVYRTPSEKTLKLIESGKVFLEDGPVHNAKVRVVDTTDKTNAWVEITVTEGRNRLIRRLFQQVGHPVAKLRRESFGTISIRGLERGQARRLTADEVRRLRDLSQGIKPKKAGRVKRKAGFAVPRKKMRRTGRGQRKPKRG